MEQGSKEWHQERMLGIGGSDAAAALGLSHWKTPFQLYEEKLGLSEPIDETWDMSRGKAMEPLLRQHFADTYGVNVSVPTAAMVSAKYPYMRYNPDGLTDDGILCEFKTARYSKDWGAPNSDEVPQEYLLQIQHGLIVTGFDVARPSVSIGGGEPVYYEVKADRNLQEMIIESEAAFWERVQNRIPPDATTNEDVARKFRRVNGLPIAADDIINRALGNLRACRDGIKTLETEKERYEVEIKNFMGENDTLVDQYGVPLATWKLQRGAVRIDSKRLKAEQPALAAQYSQQGEDGRRFLLK